MTIGLAVIETLEPVVSDTNYPGIELLCELMYDT